MIAQVIPLSFAGDSRSVRLRELTGNEEYAVLGAGTPEAIALLSALLAPASPGEEKIDAVDLVAADRDRLLAAVYDNAFGDRIESTLTCSHCRQPFDLDFSLRQLMETVSYHPAPGDWRLLGEGRFESKTGTSFRLPTGRDELEVPTLTSGDVESWLLRRCVPGGAWPDGLEAFEELLDQVAPLLDLELLARCVECAHVNMVRFDIQSYVLGAVVAERRRLLAEINRLARAYSWSLGEILSLSRSDRRQFVELIENEYIT